MHLLLTTIIAPETSSWWCTEASSRRPEIVTCVLNNSQEQNSPAGVSAPGRTSMFKKFSNLAVLCIALAAAAGMLAWVSALAINVLLDAPGDSAAAMKSVQPTNEGETK